MQSEKMHISDPGRHIRVSQRSPTIAIQTEKLADNTGERITAAYGIQLRVQDFLLQRLNRQEFKLSLLSDTLQTANSCQKTQHKQEENIIPKFIISNMSSFSFLSWNQNRRN